MLRLCCRKTLRWVRLSRPCAFSSSLTRNDNNSNNTTTIPDKSADCQNNLKNPQHVPSRPPPPPVLQPHPHPYPRRASLIALSAALVSAVIASYFLIRNDNTSSTKKVPATTHIYEDIESAIEKSNDSFKKILHRMKQTGAAASVLWQFLRSVMSSANHEVRTGFELRVAALLADISAVSDSRRAAIVGADGGAVVDWLLETAASTSGENIGTQAESARALAYLIADPNVCEAVFGRPHAVPYLLRFIFSAQPRKNQKRHSSFDVSDSLKGRSMLVAAILDVVTSNCVTADKEQLKSLLPKNADMRDIAAAIEVLEQGGIHWDEPPEDEVDDKSGKQMKGIGIKILEGTTVLGISRTNWPIEMDHSNLSNVKTVKSMPQSLLYNTATESSPSQTRLLSAVVPGLWDDLHSEHVAVPFAAWALANWAMASEVNRSHIQELDLDGQAIMTALVAPERSVKWHGSLVAQLLLEDQNLQLNESVSDWGSSLLFTTFQASKSQDIPLAKTALSAFLVSIEKSPNVREVVMEKGLHLMRETAKQTTKHKSVQESLALALELLCNGKLHMSLEECQKWSGILLPWVFSEHSSDILRAAAINILSHILEDYGPSSVPVSQAWLTILLTNVLNSRKLALNKGSTQPGSDKVKTQIEQSNVVSAIQIVNQLAIAVVHLSGAQLGVATGCEDTFPLTNLLSVEPFAGPFKNLKKDKMPKINVADSAMATLKGIKALTEVCAEDSRCQNKIADYGVLCLLKRLLMEDDYEQLAAIEAYDASRALKEKEEVASVPSETSVSNNNDSSSVRVPPTAHIRKHAARLLTVLSVLPKVQKMVVADETWCKWLEECANGRIPGCNDLKIRSYARATLLNILSTDQSGRDSVDVPDDSLPSKNNSCPCYSDMIFLINPERPHWNCLHKAMPNSTDKSSLVKDGSAKIECGKLTGAANGYNSSTEKPGSEICSELEVPPLDVVFVHGLLGGPFRSWRLSEDKSSTTSGLVEKIDEEAGKQGTFWPAEWLPADFPDARVFSLKYKTNVTQWSGASLPLQEVSSMLLEKLVAAGIGDRPVVFVSHSMGGLVVKQILHQAKAENRDDFIKNCIGIVFYSCPHFGSKLADMPWHMGLVFRPAPTIRELRSGSPRLVELNDFIRDLHKNGMLEVLSFSETKVTPLVEGYGGWAFRMEIVPMESAYPGFGQLVVLESTDHINSCKPVSRSDPSYKETLDFLHKLKERCT